MRLAKRRVSLLPRRKNSTAKFTCGDTLRGFARTVVVGVIVAAGDLAFLRPRECIRKTGILTFREDCTKVLHVSG
jgi:hypothetical protein